MRGTARLYSELRPLCLFCAFSNLTVDASPFLIAPAAD